MSSRSCVAQPPPQICQGRSAPIKDRLIICQCPLSTLSFCFWTQYVSIVWCLHATRPSPVVLVTDIRPVSPSPGPVYSVCLDGGATAWASPTGTLPISSQAQSPSTGDKWQNLAGTEEANLERRGRSNDKILTILSDAGNIKFFLWNTAFHSAWLKRFWFPFPFVL